MKRISIVEFLGDGISSELSESVHTVAASLPFQVEFQAVDLSLENRKKRGADLHMGFAVQVAGSCGLGLVLRSTLAKHGA